MKIHCFVFFLSTSAIKHAFSVIRSHLLCHLGVFLNRITQTVLLTLFAERLPCADASFFSRLVRQRGVLLLGDAVRNQQRCSMETGYKGIEAIKCGEKVKKPFISMASCMTRIEKNTPTRCRERVFVTLIPFFFFAENNLKAPSC